MYPELEMLRAKEVPDHVLAAASSFLDSGDPSIPRQISVYPGAWSARRAAAVLLVDSPWNERTRGLVRFFTHMSEGSPPARAGSHGYLSGILSCARDERLSFNPGVVAAVVEEIEGVHGALDEFIRFHLNESGTYGDWRLAGEPGAADPFVSPAANFILRHITPAYAAYPELLCAHGDIFHALALHQPALTRVWCEQSPGMKDWSMTVGWRAIIDATDAFDDLCLAFCDAVAKPEPRKAFLILNHLDVARGGVHADTLKEVSEHPHVALGHQGLDYLMENRKPEVIAIMTKAFANPRAKDFMSFFEGPGYTGLFALMLECWDTGGRELLRAAVPGIGRYIVPSLLRNHLVALQPGQSAALREDLVPYLATLPVKEQMDIWKTAAESHPAVFLSEFEGLLLGKSKPLREIAASALTRAMGKDGLGKAEEWLASKKADARLGGAGFLEKLGYEAAVPLLQAALEKEQSEEVRAALHKAMAACGAKADAAPREVAAVSLAELEAGIAKQAAKLKLPAASWLKAEALPPVFAKDGSELSKAAIAFLVSKQAKHKNIEAAPDVLPLLSHIDREKSSPFGVALVQGFLNSEQAAVDRWALTLGGLIGDKRIIPPLLSRINDWCENARHKLAEYSAQAISLLPGNEALMVLDTLSKRYRSKFKNVGKACAEAFTAAATARGITPDELGDMVVPDFGFDADGMRLFEWEGGKANAELGADFKLAWSDPESEKSWKALPASAPEAVKNEVKMLTKLLKEAVKGQTARLEMTLVRQRRWPVARWRELYENHPLLRSFASSLVWGIYDASGTLIRTFRRYPNGLLANAAGDLEELPEGDTLIGMVHPLEMEAVALDAWRAHLARFKVKQPFPQIDRPVELLDPLHGNRREITLTSGKKVGAGTFKSRSEKRGWFRGSVIDGGGISSIYKPFPGAGYEVILPTDSYYMGIDPMESVELESAYFIKADSVGRGSYTYDEPDRDDPRVLRFDQVPAVVFSETMADLKAIIGQ